MHDLRHTGNTLAAETGATLREIATGLNRIVAEARDQAEEHVRGTNGAGLLAHDREWRPFPLVSELERATGIEPA